MLPFGGGTDLFVAARMHSEQRVFQDTVLCVKEIPELLRIDEQAEQIMVERPAPLLK